MANLDSKLKRIKVLLWTWNKEVFGMVEHHIRSLEKKIEMLEGSLQITYSNEVNNNLISTSIELDC